MSILSLLRSVTILHVALLSCVGDTSQLPLSCELLMQHLELVDEFLTDGRKHVAGRDGAIRLDTDEELRDVGVSNLISGHVDIRMSLDMLGEKVTKGVVLLLEHEIGGVGHARVNLLFNLLLAVSEEEELETIWGVHLVGLGSPKLEVVVGWQGESEDGHRKEQVSVVGSRDEQTPSGGGGFREISNYDPKRRACD